MVVHVIVLSTRYIMKHIAAPMQSLVRSFEKGIVVLQ